MPHEMLQVAWNREPNIRCSNDLERHMLRQVYLRITSSKDQVRKFCPYPPNQVSMQLQSFLVWPTHAYVQLTCSKIWSYTYPRCPWKQQHNEVANSQLARQDKWKNQVRFWSLIMTSSLLLSFLKHFKSVFNRSW